MSRKRKALVREMRRGIDDWHLFMDDARNSRYGNGREEIASARRDINRARRALFNIKKKTNMTDAGNYGEEYCMF